MKKTIEAILYSNLNPLLPDKRGEDYYRPEYRKIGTVNEAFDAHYQINFDAPRVSTKVLYYERLISNAITTELNRLLIDEQLSGNRVLYARKKLYGSIYGYLSDIKNIINKYDFDLDALLITKDYSKMLQQNECTFIFHYLILALIRCYMEFQQHFISSIPEEKRESISDFFIMVLQQQMPSKVGIKERIKVEIPITDDKPKQKEIATGITLAFRYTKLQAESDNINTLFAELKKHGAIPSDYPITEFKHLFSGVPVSNPIPWIGEVSELYYLFKLLVTTHKVLTMPKKATTWIIVDASFVDGSGKHFGYDRLRTQKVPKKTKDDIEHFAYLMT